MKDETPERRFFVAIIKIKILVALCVYFLSASILHASSTIHLKDGNIVTGDIVERTDEYIKVKCEGVELIYWNDQIEEVEADEGGGNSPFDGLQKTSSLDQTAVLERIIPPPSNTDVAKEGIVQRAAEDIQKAKSDAPVYIPFPSGIQDVQDFSQAQSQASKIESQVSAPPPSFGREASVTPSQTMAGLKGRRSASIAIALVTMTAAILTYLFFCFCFRLIAVKTGIPDVWLAWIPIANLYLLCKIAGKPAWWLLCFFIPFLNILFMVLLWMGIAEARHKPGWLGLLTLVPVINIFIPVYLAFSK